MVRNKLLKGWQNWRPMASRISPEFEAIFCNSLKHKEPGFSSPYKTSGGLLSVDLNRLCLIVSTPAYISRHILQPGGLRIHWRPFKNTLTCDKRSKCIMHVTWAFAPVRAMAWKHFDFLALQVWWPFSKFCTKALPLLIKDTVAETHFYLLLFSLLISLLIENYFRGLMEFPSNSSERQVCDLQTRQKLGSEDWPVCAVSLARPGVATVPLTTLFLISCLLSNWLALSDWV